MPLSALLLISLGGLWLAIWQRGWRWLGLAPMVLGAALAWTAPLPDMLVASDAATIAIRGEDGLLHFVRKPLDKYAVRDWLRRDGDGRDIADVMGVGAVGLPGLRCDGLGCVVKRNAATSASLRPLVIAAGLRPEALEEDCVRAQVVISAAQAAGCKGPAVMIDQRAAEQGGGWRVSLSPAPTAVSVRALRGERPWVKNRE
jgi:competence protein ComEC